MINTFQVIHLSLTIVARVGKRRTLVIPKRMAEEVGLKEGDKVKLTLQDGKIIIEPSRDAIWLSIHGRKIAKVSLRDLEAESLEQQERYLSK